ncbi:hypothetical protein DNTS_014938 [Danionella cerebrum]|uniref:Uncharacterized protein n=1 Tax=Danionella cerebrum TaxID=2873325 RepID=A0A553RJ19_9TELE|nr:hypothetical protein DNTS_014938 [Danionella translucida]
MTSEDDHCLGTFSDASGTTASSTPSRSLTLLEELCSTLSESCHLIPPTPPPSSEGDDGRSTESSMNEIWREEEEETGAFETIPEEQNLIWRKGFTRENDEEIGATFSTSDDQNLIWRQDVFKDVIPEEQNDKETNQEMGATSPPPEDQDLSHEEKHLILDEDVVSEPLDTNAPPSSSSSSFVIPELRLDRSFSADALSTPGTDEDYEEDVEDDDEEEDEDSDEQYLERSDSKRRSMVEASSCEKHSGGLSVQNSLRRRTHSEGSLLQDPRTTCFTSDNALNCMEGAGAHPGGWTLPSPKTLKKELTKNGGSMHQLYMLFSGRKVGWLGTSIVRCKDKMEGQMDGLHVEGEVLKLSRKLAKLMNRRMEKEMDGMVDG